MSSFKVKRKAGKPKQDEVFRSFQSRRVCPEGFKFYKIERGRIIFRRIKKKKEKLFIAKDSS